MSFYFWFLFKTGNIGGDPRKTARPSPKPQSKCGKMDKAHFQPCINRVGRSLKTYVPVTQLIFFQFSKISPSDDPSNAVHWTLQWRTPGPHGPSKTTHFESLESIGIFRAVVLSHCSHLTIHVCQFRQASRRTGFRLPSAPLVVGHFLL